MTRNIFSLFCFALLSLHSMTNANEVGEPCALLGGNPENRGQGSTYTDFYYPLGWSEDGKFAYAIKKENIAGEDYWARFIIQDLTTDRIIWEVTFTAENVGQTEKEVWPAAWSHKKEVVLQQMKKENIIYQNTSILGRFPAQFPNEQFTINITTRNEENQGFPGLNSVVEYDVLLSSSKKGEKYPIHVDHSALFNDSNWSSQMNCPFKVEAAGFLKSPFENRLAVIIYEYVSYPEGDIVKQLRTLGCHLEQGFKRHSKQ